MATIHSTSWACSDCMMLVANGETPPELDESETQEWLDRIDRRTGGFHVVPGGDHDEDCPNVVDGQWVGTTDCQCETQEFSWSCCGVCGSPLGGPRHAVTLFVR